MNPCGCCRNNRGTGNQSNTCLTQSTGSAHTHTYISVLNVYLLSSSNSVASPSSLWIPVEHKPKRALSMGHKSPRFLPAGVVSFPGAFAASSGVIEKMRAVRMLKKNYSMYRNIRTRTRRTRKSIFGKNRKQETCCFLYGYAKQLFCVAGCTNNFLAYPHGNFTHQ